MRYSRLVLVLFLTGVVNAVILYAVRVLHLDVWMHLMDPDTLHSVSLLLFSTGVVNAVILYAVRVLHLDVWMHLMDPGML